MGAMQELASAYRALSGVEVDAEFAPTVALLDRIRGGEAGDVAILTAQGIEDLIAEGVMVAGSRVDIAVSFVGIAVRGGAPKPDISSVEALRAALLAARCVAYSKIGASGIFFAGLLERMGLAGRVNTLIVPSGFTAEKLVSGEADLAVQQISELMVVPGIDVVGPLPPEIQTAAMFSGGVSRACSNSGQAREFLRFLAGPEAAPVLVRCGLKPAP